MFTKDMATIIIENEVSTWSKNYVHSIKLESETEDEMKFSVTFSKPTEISPIPDFIVVVHFSVTNFTQPILNYRIEQQRFEHNVEYTIFREEWLDRALEQKAVLTKSMGPTPSTRLLPPGARSKYITADTN